MKKIADLECKSVISVLRILIEILNDSRDGFYTAALGVEDPELKLVLDSIALQRETFLEALALEMESLYGDDESCVPSADSGWINIRSALLQKSEERILTECERGERHIRQCYEQILRKSLPSELMSLIKNQFQQIKSAQDYLFVLMEGSQ